MGAGIDAKVSAKMARVLRPHERAPALDISLPTPFALLRQGSSAAARYLLLLRFGVLNMVACALLGAAWFKGWILMMYEGDSTHLVVVIAGAFAAGLCICAWRVWQTSEDINRVRGGDMPPWLERLNIDALKLKLGARTAMPRNVASTLVLLGLIGTVIGFVIALSGVKASAASDVAAVGPMISTLIAGMGVALYTTLVGAVLNIWLMANCRLLEGGAVALVVAVAERREERF